MDENWIRWLIGGAFVTITGVLRHIYVRQQEYVTRDELNTTLRDMRDERKEMHRANQDRLNRIHERVDALWEKLT